MAMPNYGVTFLPQGDALYRQKGQQPQGSAPVQEAVKVLSLRVPNVLGANPLAPLALLTAPGSGEVPAGLLQQLLRQQGLLGAPPAPTTAAPSSPMTPPTPSSAPVSAPAPPPVPQPTVAGVGATGAAEAPPMGIAPATPMPGSFQPPPQSSQPIPSVLPSVTGAGTSAPLQPSIPTLPMLPNQPAPSIPPPRVTPGALPGQPGPPPLPAPVPPPVTEPEPMAMPDAGLPPGSLAQEQGPRADDQSWLVVQELLRRLRGGM